ncbi:uncharacterized protein [Elaeis guineensis]|uniref:uncharacterized protein n=1 Tax=Elaeis guineensis var. tenera TaxID=51953 RepID=UPI003C6D071C
MPSPTSLSSTKRLLHFFLLLLLVGSALARNRHVITFGSPGLAPVGLAWDPTAQHFLVGSRLRPAVSSVSDAGVVETLLSDPLLPPDSSAPALAVDNRRRRLLVAFARPASLAAYDLRSPRPHRRIFSSSLPDPAAVPGGIAMDSTTGDAFVTSATGNLIWKVDLDGNPTVFSKSPIYFPQESAGDEDRPEAATAEGGLGGVAHVSWGFLLAVQGSTGRVFKVDAEWGAARAVTDAGAKKGLATEAEGVAVRSDGGVVVAGGRAARWLTSQDGWAVAAVYDEAAVEEGRARAVAVREGRRVYLLVTPEEEEDGGNMGRGDDGGYEGKRNRIEEVEWRRESEEDMVWVLVLVGLGLAYFFYWRFQMGQLVTNMNKKRA